MAESKRFKPHYNRALGKYYHTSKDYVGDMKKGGYEPYDPSVKSKMSTPYTPSKECQEVTRAAIQQLKRDGKVSGAVKDWVAKNGSAKVNIPDRIKNARQGGMYEE